MSWKAAHFVAIKLLLPQAEHVLHTRLLVAVSATISYVHDELHGTTATQILLDVYVLAAVSYCEDVQFVIGEHIASAIPSQPPL